MAPRRPQGRETSLGRRSGVRSPRRKILVVCEGETEYHYFSGLRDSDRHDIQPVQPEKARHPQRDRVVDHARQARSKAAYSQVWAVFDADCADVSDLCAQAKNDRIGTAVSNPTFEVWLILHLCEKVGERTSAGVERELKKLLPKWSKGRGTRFEHFADGVDDACRRARRLPEYGNPSTRVWELMEELHT